jgi:hypothetical protein
VNEKGAPQPPPQDNWFQKLDNAFRLSDEAWRWVSRVYSNYPKVNTYNPTLTPSSVSANAEGVQTFTVTGLSTQDIVLVNKPTNQSGLDLIHTWVSAANTLSIKYRNQTGSPITPTAEAYRIATIRI